jgi:hypothetical protein
LRFHTSSIFFIKGGRTGEVFRDLEKRVQLTFPDHLNPKGAEVYRSGGGGARRRAKDVERTAVGGEPRVVGVC